MSAVFFRGLFQMIPVLLGVGAGYLLALLLGRVDLKPLAEAPWVGLPPLTLATLEWGAVLLIAPVAFVTVMEHIGDILTNGRVVGKDFFARPGLHRTLLGDGLATSLAGLLGGPANTTYSENTGVLAVTRVYDPLVLRIAAIFAILLSFSPKLAALLQTLPQGVLGGISMLLFGMIAPSASAPWPRRRLTSPIAATSWWSRPSWSWAWAGRWPTWGRFKWRGRRCPSR